MRITVRLHTILRRETPEGIIDRLTLDLPQGADVSEAVRRMEFPVRPRTMLTVVNGKIVPEDHVLADGDELRLVPGISGGADEEPQTRFIRNTGLGRGDGL
jgi:sulfur carrier protein ThiS